MPSVVPLATTGEVKAILRGTEARWLLLETIALAARDFVEAQGFPEINKLSIIDGMLRTVVAMPEAERTELRRLFAEALEYDDEVSGDRGKLGV